MALARDDRVRLTRGAGEDGTVLDVLEGGDDAEVRLDSGGTCTVSVDELIPLAGRMSDKAWPPGGIETK